ncbi:ferredoxin [Streptomyces sp. SAJ15]|uniref:ferredoxin n=1 Tax=Streptomyces sp. SAJ15 TaxID=2011095 RepID=UPI0011858F13|nr:ferredoxin [Streptomyces sp. SAJ15]TVL90002.1 ferredoxin [Streptomyces sp. SAJ15]
MADRWRAAVDHGLCVGSGLCVSTAPHAFRLDGATRRSRPVTPEVEASDAVLAAAEGCPVEAIVLRLGDGGEPVFPPAE